MCVFFFCLQFNPERKSLEVTMDPSVTGTVEFLAMITDPKVSANLYLHFVRSTSCVLKCEKCSESKIITAVRQIKFLVYLLISRTPATQRSCTSWAKLSVLKW